MRIETQKQTLGARDESIKKLMEAMQSKGISNKMMEEERMEMERVRTRNIELETRLRHMESIAEMKERDSLRVSYHVRHCIHFYCDKQGMKHDLETVRAGHVFVPIFLTETRKLFHVHLNFA